MEDFLPSYADLRVFVGATYRVKRGADFNQIYQNALNLLETAKRSRVSKIVSDREERDEPLRTERWNLKRFAEQNWREFEQGASPDEIAKRAFVSLGEETGAERITLFLGHPHGKEMRRQLEWISPESQADSLPEWKPNTPAELFWSVSPHQPVLTVDRGSGELYDRLRECFLGAPLCPTVICIARENETVTLGILAEGVKRPSLARRLESLTAFLRRIYFVQELRSRCRSAALQDAVTPLFNFEAYLQRLQRIREDVLSSLGIASVYIPNFKKYNQKYGMNGGNALLREIARILGEVFGAESCYRVSGATFRILCPDITYEYFMKQYQALEGKIAQKCAGRAVCASVWEQNAISLEEMEQQVDERIEIAANRLCAASSETENQSVDAILQGVKEKIESGNFTAYLQPKALAATGEICGAEALIRYRDEQQRVLPPSEFLRAIENAGAIREIDLFVLESICRTMRRWLDDGWEGFPVSLNFSRATILEPGILEVTNRIVEHWDIPKKQIEIEITETISSIDSIGLQDIVGRLSREGYRIAIDDFGADYSNIYVLYLLDIDTLKFDRKIINDIYYNKRAQTVVQTLLGLCRKMNITSVAEGVQTPEQLEALRKMSCDLIQGYYLNKPISMEEFRRLYIRTEEKTGPPDGEAAAMEKH